MAFNEKQKAFDAANPAGTKEADIKAPTQEQVDAQKGSLTFNATTAPAPVKPVEAPKPTTTAGKTTPSVNFDSSAGREVEINSNLSRISGDNPALLQDRQAFDKAFGYATADEGKKALLDSFFESKKPAADENSLFGMLAT